MMILQKDADHHRSAAYARGLVLRNVGAGRLTSVSVQQTSMKANMTVQKAMGGAAKAMAVSNKQMDMQKMQATLQQFEKQQQLASMTEEYERTSLALALLLNIGLSDLWRCVACCAG